MHLGRNCKHKISTAPLITEGTSKDRTTLNELQFLLACGLLRPQNKRTPIVGRHTWLREGCLLMTGTTLLQLNAVIHIIYSGASRLTIGVLSNGNYKDIDIVLHLNLLKQS